jgi:hypothetical protein
LSGMKLWERTSACTVDNLLENIGIRIRVDGTLLLRWIDKIHFNFIGSLGCYVARLRRHSPRQSRVPCLYNLAASPLYDNMSE